MNLFELFVKIGVDDQASGKLGEIGQKLGNGLKTAAKIGTAAVATAAAGIAALTGQAVRSFAEYEQLAGGAAKIFDEMSQTEILQDAQNAYKDLGISANQYLAIINDVGATFAATMGDKKGYDAAKKGLKAISDYASGTGKNVDELSQKFTLITRSTSSYQSIADQFSGILPATSVAFLEQAQAAGILSEEYQKLTDVPIDEYQEAVAAMLEQGVASLGLAGNTAAEAMTTISGSLSMAKGAWSNLVTGLADDSADLDMLIGNFVESVGAVATQLIPKIGTALNGASKLVSDLIPVIVQEIPVLIEENLPILASAAVSVIQSLADGISQNSDTLVGAVFDAFKTIVSKIPSLIKSFAELVPDLVDSILGELPGAIESIVDALVDGNVAENLTNAVVEIVQSIADNLPNIIQAIVDAIPRITESVNNAILLNFPALLQAIIQIVLEIVRNLPSIIQMLVDQIGPIVSTITRVLVENLPTLLAGVAQIIFELVKALPSLTVSLFDSVFSIFEGIGTGIVDAWPKFKEGMADLWDRLSNWFGEKWDAVKTWGKDLIDNFIAGIKEKWEDLKQTVSNVAQSVRDYIGFSEPKKGPLSNFHTYAPDMMDLFAKGIRDNESVVKDQIAKSFDFGRSTMEFGAEYANSRGYSGSSFGGTSIENVTINISGVDVENVDQLADLIADKLNSDIINRRLAYG